MVWCCDIAIRNDEMTQESVEQYCKRMETGSDARARVPTRARAAPFIPTSRVVRAESGSDELPLPGPLPVSVGGRGGRVRRAERAQTTGGRGRVRGRGEWAKWQLHPLVFRGFWGSDKPATHPGCTQR